MRLNRKNKMLQELEFEATINNCMRVYAVTTDSGLRQDLDILINRNYPIGLDEITLTALYNEMLYRGLKLP